MNRLERMPVPVLPTFVGALTLGNVGKSSLIDRMGGNPGGPAVCGKNREIPADLQKGV